MLCDVLAFSPLNSHFRVLQCVALRYFQRNQFSQSKCAIRRLIALYAVWFYYDYDRPRRGGGASAWFKRLVVFRWLRDYFPVRLHKTVDLDPTRNYIMGYHPHGMMAVGAFTNFATDATNFETVR